MAVTTSQSVWSFVGTVKTACGAVTSMSENFDSYNTGTTLPDCWVRNFVNGTMTISSTTPASGTRNIYQTNTSTQTPSTVVLPEFSNINAGTHWLKLKARGYHCYGNAKCGLRNESYRCKYFCFDSGFKYYQHKLYKYKS